MKIDRQTDRQIEVHPNLLNQMTIALIILVSFYQDAEEAIEAGSAFASMTLPEAGSINAAAMSVESRAEIVTSCLGRSSATASRAESAMTNASTTSVNDQALDVETIQWKRGNLLGKGRD